MGNAYHHFRIENCVAELLNNCNSVEELYAEKIAIRYTVDRLVHNRYRTLVHNECSPVENTENV